MTKRYLIKPVMGAALTVLVLVFALCFAAAPAYADVSGDLDSLNVEMSEIQEKICDIQEQIDDLDFQRQSVMEKKATLDEKNTLTQQELDVIAEQIDILDNYMANRQSDLEAARQNETEQREKALARLRALEENEKIGFVQVLFESSSFADFLTRLDTVIEIATYDEEVFNDYIEARQTVEEMEAEAEEMAELNAAKKAEYEAKKAELDADVEAACAMIAALEDDIDAYQELLDEEAEHEAEISAAISEKLAAYYAAQISAEEVTAAARSGGSAVYSGDGTTLLWPSWSTWISSYYGKREAPTAGASTDHMGIDITGTDISGTDVWNAGSGTVIASGTDSSRGNYVTVAMDNGYTATYMHLSESYVSSGDYVSQGESVGTVGSTGISTGAHLDFRIQDSNGDYVDPTSFEYVYAD